jgi:5'-3' exonuclease
VKLHLVDGTYELFRAHYSKRPERRNKAIVGLIDSLLTLTSDPEEGLTHVAVAFDNPIRSFRNDLFDGYKTEEGVEPELLAQFDGAERATRALGMVAWPMDRFEADDALATAAARFADSVEQVRILTPDKDLGQCIRGQKVVQVDRMRRRVIDEPALLALRGIAPASIPDWLALVGDVADGVPGLAGFGEKSAAAVLAAFGHLEQIPDDFHRWPRSIRGTERLAATLAGQRADALLYRTLTQLRTDVPLAETLDQLTWRGVPAGFEAWCTELGADHLRRRAAPAS